MGGGKEDLCANRSLRGVRGVGTQDGDQRTFRDWFRMFNIGQRGEDFVTQGNFIRRRVPDDMRLTKTIVQGWRERNYARRKRNSPQEEGPRRDVFYGEGQFEGTARAKTEVWSNER